MIKKRVPILRLVLCLIVLTLSCGNSAEKISGSSGEDEKPKTVRKVKVTFIELGSVRCIPCRKMMPIMKEIEAEYGDQVDVIFYDVWTDEGKPYAIKYGIKLIPTQVFLDDKGQEYFRHVGFFPKEELVAVLKQKGVE